MLKIMKGFTGLGAFLILVVGLAMLGVTIWAFTNAALSFNQYTILGVLLAFDLVLIFGSVIGICGIKRQNGFMICLFQILVMFFFFGFVGIGIASELLPGTIFNGDCKASTNNQLITQAYNITLGTQLAFCYGLCPCGLTDASIAKAGYNITDMIYINSLNRKGSAVRFQDCDVAKNLSPSELDMINILEAVETTLDCSGWCHEQWKPYYLFSNVNNGKPQVACYESMKEKLFNYGAVVGLSAFIAAAFMMLVCVCGLCVCCAPQSRSQPMSSRFIVNDGGQYRRV